jgi:hypothetical protein
VSWSARGSTSSPQWMPSMRSPWNVAAAKV